MSSDSTIEIQCDVCDNTAELGGEVNEKTLEDEGWYLGDISTLCPTHAGQPS